MHKIPQFETPDWLLVSGKECVVELYVAVVEDFLEVISAIFDIRGRDMVFVRFYAIGDGLLSDVDYPDHFECKKAAVEAARRSFGERSTHTYNVHQMGRTLSGDQTQSEAGDGKVRVFSGGRARGADLARHAATAERINQTLEHIKKTGQWRPLQLPPKDWRERLKTLAAQFPNFAHVVEMVLKPHLGILEKGGLHRQAPVLLVGPPGVGKTHFANAMARVMGLQGALLINLAEETNGSSLAGSSLFWENSSPGKIFEILCWGDGTAQPVANPLVVLDELDKPNPVQHKPTAALYTLLEQDTARRFRDQALPDLVIEASYISYVAIANQVREIPGPLLSRMVTFHINPPTAQQLRGVVRTIFSDLVDSTRLPLSRDLPDSLIDVAVGMSPREIKTRLECAIAYAVMADRKSVRLADWPELPTVESQQRRKIGFVA